MEMINATADQIVAVGVNEMPDTNGFTNKEMLQLLLENQSKMDAKLEDMQTKLEGKIGKMELMGYLLMVSAVLMIAVNWQALTSTF